jgi:hypothetical protein
MSHGHQVDRISGTLLSTKQALAATASNYMLEAISETQRFDALALNGKQAPVHLLLAVLLVAIGIFGNSALACSARHGVPSDRNLMVEATSITWARIGNVQMKKLLRSSECEGLPCGIAEVTYEVIERYKGGPALTGTFKATQCIVCGFCLEVGQEYLLFEMPNGSVDAMVSALLDEQGRRDNDSRLRWLRENAQGRYK